MSWHVHTLSGCRPRPLASYLKALAVLRLVAEQADPLARGFWCNEVFCLATTLDGTALETFFLERWKPTAFVTPWNKSSGFFSSSDKGLTPIELSSSPRFELMRKGIREARILTGEMNAAVQREKEIKAEANQLKTKAAKDALRNDADYARRLKEAKDRCSQLKKALQPECQRQWRGSSLQWLRAAVVLGQDGSARFPSLLGTGGTDAKLEFVNNSYQRLNDLFDVPGDGNANSNAAPLLRAALHGHATPGKVLGGIGQFDPAASGGANATCGALGVSMLNPWDLLLLLEGSVLFSSGTSRRLLGRAAPQASAPFAVQCQGAAFGSASGAEKHLRGEQWMPLWHQLWSLPELQAVLTDGRAQLGPRSSETTVDMARSVARLGVARGISSFERYGYLQRNGKSNYAVPLGRWRVSPSAHASLLDDLDANGWWARIRRAANGDRTPASFARAERRLADAALGALARGRDEAQRWAEVLTALAGLEAQMVASGAFTVSKRLGPIPSLAPEWVAAINDGTPEHRLALSLAGAGASHDGDGKPRDSVRAHWLPLDRSGLWFAAGEKGLNNDPRVVVHGRHAETDLIALVQRRLVEAATGAARRLPLRPAPGTGATQADIAAILAGHVDLDRVLLLARGLAALDWTRRQPATAHPAPRGVSLDPSYLVLRLTHPPGPLDGRKIPVDPSATRLLAAGDATRAFAVMLRRLRASGLSAPIRVVALDAARARRFAASLAFPIDSHTLAGWARSLDPAAFELELTHVD